MKVHEHSSTSVINREALELHTKRNLKLQLVNSTSSESRPPPFWIRVITPCCSQCFKHRARDRMHRSRGRLPPNWKTWPLPGAGQDDDDDNMQKYPLIGSLREKEGQHPVLEVYYFHISWFVCEPLRPLYILLTYFSWNILFLFFFLAIY